VASSMTRVFPSQRRRSVAKRSHTITHMLLSCTSKEECSSLSSSCDCVAFYVTMYIHRPRTPVASSTCYRPATPRRREPGWARCLAAPWASRAKWTCCSEESRSPSPRSRDCCRTKRRRRTKTRRRSRTTWRACLRPGAASCGLRGRRLHCWTTAATACRPRRRQRCRCWVQAAGRLSGCGMDRRD